jgi:uncharacterized protein (DUF433 family)
MTTTTSDPFRMGKAYTVRQAADFAHVSPKTIRDWLWAEGEGHSVRRVFGDKARDDDAPASVSFLELAEIVVVAKWRKLKIKLDRIRDAHEFAREEWNAPYPFATLNLLTLGGHVLGRFQEAIPGQKLVVLSSPQQYVLPDIVRDELLQFDYNETDHLADRWYPYGRDLPVVVDPRYAGGVPTVQGRGVSIDIILRRWKAKQGFQAIARDLRLKPPQVEAILQQLTT